LLYRLTVLWTTDHIHVPKGYGAAQKIWKCCRSGPAFTTSLLL
jgi:hypothetical protein